MSQRSRAFVTLFWGVLVGILLSIGPLSPIGTLIVIGYIGFVLAVYPSLRNWLTTRTSSLLGRFASAPVNTTLLASSSDEPDFLRDDYEFSFEGSDALLDTKKAITPLPQTREIKVYTIRLAKDTDYRPDLAVALIQKMASLGEMAFRITAEGNTVRWQLVDVHQRHEPSLIIHAVRSVYPDAMVEVGELEEPSVLSPFHRLTFFFEQTNITAAPIRYAKDLKNDDPLGLVVNTLAHVQPDERVSYLVYLGNPGGKSHAEAMKEITRSKWGSRDLIVFILSGFTIVGAVFFTFYLFWKLFFGKRPEKYEPADMRIFYEKLADMLFGVSVGIQIDSPVAQNTVHFDIEPVFKQFGTPYQSLVAHIPKHGSLEGIYHEIKSSTDARRSDLLLQMDNWARHPSQAPPHARNILTASEVATLWHLPHQKMQASGIDWAKGKLVPMPASLRNRRDGIFLGVNTIQGRNDWVCLSQANRTTPVMVLGKTGMGKSNLMHQMIHQDIQAGRAVVVIDPHGKLVSDVLQSSIPPERAQDVVIIDLADTQNPAPLNPLRGLSGDVAVSRMVDVLDKLYPNLGDLSQTGDALENALMTLQVLPDAVLWDLDRLFTSSTFRGQLLKELKNPVVRRFWEDEYDQLALGEQVRLRAPITRRLRRFYRSEALRTMICHPNALDFGQLVRERKIILISLHAQETAIPEQEQRLIGALLVSRLQIAALSGAFSEELPCFCYVDELQHFVTTSINEVFSEARKFNLSLTMANQYLHQLKGDALQAATGNAGTMVIFRVGEDDARALAPYTRPAFDVDALMNLDHHTAALWMSDGSITQSAFSLTTARPVKKPANALEIERQLREQSRQAYTPMSHEAVLAWLTERDKDHIEENTTKGDEGYYDTRGIT